MPPSESLVLPEAITSYLSPYIPSSNAAAVAQDLPFVTLTYATSLDSHLSLSPGIQTPLSGRLSKTLTHYLRSTHASILVGVSTAIADDPGLNSRLEGVALRNQPRPVILDPSFRWGFTRDARVLRTAREGGGKAPFVITACETQQEERVQWLEEAGGKVVRLPFSGGGGGGDTRRWTWVEILRCLKIDCGLESVMVEGGGEVINSLLAVENRCLVRSVVVTIAPVYLGRGGVNVSPATRTTEGGERVAAVRFRDVEWCVLGGDVVMAGRLAV